MTRSTCLACALSAVLLRAGSAAAADEWPQFRGPGGQGRSGARSAPLVWSETENVAWRTPVPGRGWSSPVVSEGAVWVTAAVETPASEEAARRRAAAIGSSQPLAAARRVGLRAVGLDRASGKVRHDVEVLAADDPEPIHALNSYASPTPVIEDGRVYCHFGAMGTASVDALDGRVLWTNGELRCQSENGPGGSPVPWRGLLIVQMDGLDEQFVAALEKRSGRTAWRTARGGALRRETLQRQGYSTPLVVEAGGRPQLLSLGADWLYAYDPESGAELWRLACGPAWCSTPCPVAGDGFAYLGVSFPRAEVVAVRLAGAAGPEVAWRSARQAPQVPSPILVGDALVTVSDRGGIVTCLDSRSGQPRWSERLGGNHLASPVLAAGRLYIASREGEVAVVEAGATCKVLARNRLEGSIVASPAVDATGALYLRTEKAVYRIVEASRP
ncbi:MAG: PQQ-binding-like beta-propeller repeat protein [Planctomycetes bacterium]|nr:PQQ-binding-like beta-propeller repeat protein [Planctomycetota bacterium]